MKTALAFLAIIIVGGLKAASGPVVLHADDFRHYVDSFNHDDKDEVSGAISDADSWEWMKSNIPLLSTPDSDVDLTYYYRWWAYRKHIEKTPVGYVVTEFLRPVKHATEYNAISCALGLHVAEGRWLRDPDYITDYLSFWLHGGEGGGLQAHLHQFSGWTAAAVYDRWLATGDTKQMLSRLDSLLADYRAWDSERLTPSGLYWQRDVSDGMESSISGGRKVKNIRPTINSYMYGNAKAIAAMAKLAGNRALSAEYAAKAAKLRQLVEHKLWDPQAAFFETTLESGAFANVREEQGYTPWYFDLPEQGKGYEAAWKQLMDPKGFLAPFGLTTAEQRNPEFQIADKGDDCQWNGPIWPFATSITLRALANVLNDYHQQAVSKQNYFQTFLTYTKSQRLKLPDGRVIPWIDENQNPFTGVWWARELKIRKKTFYGRGDHYNHSTYADLAITGLAGLRPRADNIVEVNPLVPAAAWEWFCLDNLPYHGHTLTIVWDRAGSKFHKGKGLRLFADGKEIAHADVMGRITGSL